MQPVGLKFESALQPNVGALASHPVAHSRITVTERPAKALLPRATEAEAYSMVIVCRPEDWNVLPPCRSPLPVGYEASTMAHFSDAVFSPKVKLWYEDPSDLSMMVHAASVPATMKHTHMAQKNAALLVQYSQRKQHTLSCV